MTEPSSSRAQRRLALIRTYVAGSLLPPLPGPILGDVVLTPPQRESAARLLAILAQHGGALLADDVGTGKTFVALAVARAYERCVIIAPAALRPHWSSALRRTHTTHARVLSLQGYSRSDGPSLSGGGRALVVIDEAHHLRNPATRRYARVAAAIAGADVLLMSATPVYNRAEDVRAMLALFAGTRPDLLDPERRAALIVRRAVPAVREGGAIAAGSRPGVRWHRATRFAMDDAVLSRIMALPAPVPARGGAEAGALIRMGLLRAWCSSDAALADAVRRRRLRGAVLRDAVQVGRHPTRTELRSWALSEGEIQLGFAEVLAEGAVAEGPWMEVLDRHLAALAELAGLLRVGGARDVARAAFLRERIAAHAGVPVVAFSQYTRTVEAMYRALGDIAGVAMLTGSRARIASGPIGRLEALQRFAPRAHERPPPPAHQAIRVLLTTDLLAEGVNLQEAGVVVHLDVPWTAALRDQRVGRCVRIGSPWPVVHVYRLAPAEGVERVMRAEWRVARKAALGARLVGRAGRGGSVVEARSAMLAQLAAWLAEGTVGAEVADVSSERGAAGVGGVRLAAQRVGALPVVRGMRADRAALVVCEWPNGGGGVSARVLLPVWGRGGRWWVGGRGASLAALVEVASRGSPVAAVVPSGERARWVGGVHRAVGRWLGRERARAAVGGGVSGLSREQRRGLMRLAWVARQLSVTERARLAERLAAARTVVMGARSPAAERAVGAWLATGGRPVAAWLDRLPAVPAVPSSRPGEPGVAPNGRTRLRVLLLVPPDGGLDFAHHDHRPSGDRSPRPALRS